MVFFIPGFALHINRDFLDRSPVATAVATSAIFLTCPVRLLAMELTLSVVLHVPDTPSLSPGRQHLRYQLRATRVTSGEQRSVHHRADRVLQPVNSP
jgi:hypothetical protein